MRKKEEEEKRKVGGDKERKKGGKKGRLKNGKEEEWKWEGREGIKSGEKKKSDEEKVGGGQKIKEKKEKDKTEKGKKKNPKGRIVQFLLNYLLISFLCCSLAPKRKIFSANLLRSTSFSLPSQSDKFFPFTLLYYYYFQRIQWCWKCDICGLTVQNVK